MRKIKNGGEEFPIGKKHRNYGYTCPHRAGWVKDMKLEV